MTREEFERKVVADLAVLCERQEQNARTMDRMEGYFNTLFARVDNCPTMEMCKENRAAGAHKVPSGNSKVFWGAIGLLATFTISLFGLLFREVMSIREFLSKIGQS